MNKWHFRAWTRERDLGTSVQSLSCVWLFATPWTVARQASLSITNSQSLLKLMSIKLVMPSNHLILCCPLLLPSIFPSIRVFSNESALHIRWPKYWSFSFSISPSNEYSGLIVCRADWFDLLAVQGTPKSLLQHHNFYFIQMSQLFTWGGQSTGVSSSASVLPMNTQGWSRLGWTGWISLQSKGLSRVFSNTPVQKHQFFGAQLSSQSNSHIHIWLLEKP